MSGGAGWFQGEAERDRQATSFDSGNLGRLKGSHLHMWLRNLVRSRGFARILEPVTDALSV